QALDKAVGQAAAFGQDSSGRIQSLTTWLRGEEAAMPPPAWTFAAIPGPAAGEGWTIWQPLAGSLSAPLLTVVRGQRLTATRQVLAAALLLLGWRGGRGLSGRWRFRVWLALLAVCVCGMLRLPPTLASVVLWPALATILLGLLWTIQGETTSPRVKCERSSASKTPLAVASGTVVAIMIWALAWPSPSWSGGPEPFPILVLPAAEGERPKALVPPELLRRLEAVGQPGTEWKLVVLVDGSYTARANGQIVDLEARYDLFSLA